MNATQARLYSAHRIRTLELTAPDETTAGPRALCQMFLSGDPKSPKKAICKSGCRRAAMALSYRARVLLQRCVIGPTGEGFSFREAKSGLPGNLIFFPFIRISLSILGQTCSKKMWGTRRVHSILRFPIYAARIRRNRRFAERNLRRPTIRNGSIPCLSFHGPGPRTLRPSEE